MTSFCYTAFGFNIASEIELPELLAIPEMNQPDISITFGQCPKTLSRSTVDDWYFQANEQEFLMNVDGVASFYVADRSIVVQPHTSDLSSIRLYLLGSTFSAVLYQLEVTPLHAGVIIHMNKAVAFSGVSGAGKSTTIAQFAAREYKIMSDDVCALKIDQDNGDIYAYPAYPQIKLSSEVLADLGMPYEDLPQVNTERRKYAYISNKFENECHQLKLLYVIRKDDHVDKYSIRTLKGHEKYEALLQSCHRREMIDAFGLKQWHFQLCGKIGQKIEVKEISHSYNFEHLDKYINFIEKDLGE